LPKCATNGRSKQEVFFTLLVQVLFGIPLYASFYIQAISKLGTYLIAESNVKQQRLVLEIFERQQQGVVLINSNPECDASLEPVKRVLFSNNTFSQIIGGDVEQKMSEPLFTPMLEDRNEKD
jgi:hypothetical protein